MGIFDGIRADRLIRQVVTAGDVDSPAVEKAINKLRDLARAAVPRIFARLGTTHREQSNLIVNLLTKLITPKNLEFYFQGLADADPRVIAGAVKALKNASNVDPNLFWRCCFHIGRD